MVLIDFLIIIVIVYGCLFFCIFISLIGHGYITYNQTNPECF